MAKPKLNLEQRYSPKWDDISYLAKKLAGFRCCYPGCWEKASYTHHACYQTRDLIVPGNEDEWMIGVILFPLCEEHHNNRSNPECAHHPNNWYKGAGAGARTDARNYLDYYRLLKQGWDEKTLLMKRA